MEKSYTYSEVKEMFNLYREIEENLAIVSAINSGDPRLDCKSEVKRLREILPLYIEKFPEELRKIIGIDSKDLEMLLK